MCNVIIIYMLLTYTCFSSHSFSVIDLNCDCFVEFLEKENKEDTYDILANKNLINYLLNTVIICSLNQGFTVFYKR